MISNGRKYKKKQLLQFDFFKGYRYTSKKIHFYCFYDDLRWRSWRFFRFNLKFNINPRKRVVSMLRIEIFHKCKHER